LVGIRLNNGSRYEFSVVSFNSFFSVLYYSYVMPLQIFKRLLPAVPKLDHFWLENS
jgi:hypothetical protein